MTLFGQPVRAPLALGAFLILALIGVVGFGFFGYGCESYHVSSAELVTRSRQGSWFGSRNVYLSKGQSLVVSYDATISSGALHLYAFRKPAPIGQSGGESMYVKASGQGTFTYHAKETGLHHLSIEPTSTGKGCYDVSYTASWHVRR